MGATTPAEKLLPLETVFDLLAKPRRRETLYYLLDCTHPATVDELTEHVTRREVATRTETVSTEAYERVGEALHRTHLPRLADAGVIDYDAETGLVTRAEQIRPLDEFLHLAGEHDQQQHHHNQYRHQDHSTR